MQTCIFQVVHVYSSFFSISLLQGEVSAIWLCKLSYDLAKYVD